MRQGIEALLYGRRRREDEHAWRVWQGLAPLIPASLVELDSGRPVAGRVERAYQQARRGTKALVHFGAAVGVQDTWWEQVRPPVGRWVVVRTRLWLPPGTHSEMQVVWIEGWESWAPGDTYTRALRHEQRLMREGATIERPPRKRNATPSAASVKHESARPLGPLFQPDSFATGSDIEDVMSAATQIALDRGAVSQGPVKVGDGQLLMVWPLPGHPTFASVTARPIAAGAVWVRVMSQALDIALLAEAEAVASALRSALGTLGPDVSPSIRESDFDRTESRRLESEIQQLLEAIGAEPASWDHLSRTTFERELDLQQVTELGA